MKKVFAVIFAFLLYTNIIFTTALASDTSLAANAYDLVLSRIDIPSNYAHFNSKISIMPDGQYAYFTWYGDNADDREGGRINVVVDDCNNIISFNQYFYGNYEGDYKLSEYTFEQAKAVAEKFIFDTRPDIYKKLRLYNEFSIVNRNYEPYDFVFYRYENNIPCYDNYIFVSVNAYNCKVSAMEVVWDRIDKIYPVKNTISPERARVEMYNKIGIQTEYIRDENGALYVRYAPMTDGIRYIDAINGEILNTGYASSRLNNKNASASQKTLNLYISDELDYTNALDSVYDNVHISFDSKSYKIINVNYYMDEFGKYVLLDFVNEKNEFKTYIVDVSNGDIRYYSEQTGIKDYNYNLSYERCNVIARHFVENYEASFISGCRLIGYNSKKNSYGEIICYYNYARMINGSIYDDNGVVVGVSMATGDVVSVITGWDTIDNVGFVKGIDKEAAYERYIEKSGFELQYVKSVSSFNTNELKLVYAPNPNNDFYVDYITGEIIDSKGYVIENNDDFMDIAEDISSGPIEVLASCGIIDKQEYFKPYDNIRTNDYLLWACRAIDCKDYRSIEEVLPLLLSKNIITQQDYEKNDFITTEVGIKYIVTYLGYDELAELGDTYTTGFVDEPLINPSYIGYAAIARGLKIFDGNAFLPTEYMKRNVAAQIIYNLISN